MPFATAYDLLVLRTSAYVSTTRAAAICPSLPCTHAARTSVQLLLRCRGGRTTWVDMGIQHSICQRCRRGSCGSRRSIRPHAGHTPGRGLTVNVFPQASTTDGARYSDGAHTSVFGTQVTSTLSRFIRDAAIHTQRTTDASIERAGSSRGVVLENTVGLVWGSELHRGRVCGGEGV